MRRTLPTLLMAVLLVASCHVGARDGPIAVSVIGEGTGATQAVEASTSAGLIRLDREGQVVPGAAARWAILDDGLDYIFRIDEAAGLSATTVARRLRATLRVHAQDPEHAMLASVESVTAVTATVVEMRLKAPQLDILLLLAQPEYAVGAPTALQRAKAENADMLLAPRSGYDASSPVLLRSERVGRAVVRFKVDRNALVLGGTFTDLPVVRAAQLPREALRFDPATGLFGFAVRNPALDPALRTALSLAIDRERIVALVGAPGTVKATTIAGSTIEPPLEQRRATARALLGGRDTHVLVAMPTGPGARLMFALLAQDWHKVGIEAELVFAEAPADLVLVDRVAPPGTLAALACAASVGCDPRDRLALINPPFIPVSAPLRWSLVAPSLDLFTQNGLAAHPLDQLRTRR